MTKYTTPYTDEYIEFIKLVRNSDNTTLAEYRGEETGEYYYFTESQIENYLIAI